jgi:hypothetical protein
MLVLLVLLENTEKRGTKVKGDEGVKGSVFLYCTF